MFGINNWLYDTAKRKMKKMKKEEMEMEKKEKVKEKRSEKANSEAFLYFVRSLSVFILLLHEVYDVENCLLN